MTLFGILWLTAWPVLLVLLGTRELFNKNSEDKEKIAGAEMAIVSLFGIIILIFFAIYEVQIFRVISIFTQESVFVFVMIGLLILAVLQKVFPNWKWLQQKRDESMDLEDK